MYHSLNSTIHGLQTFEAGLGRFRLQHIIIKFVEKAASLTTYFRSRNIRRRCIDEAV